MDELLAKIKDLLDISETDESQDIKLGFYIEDCSQEVINVLNHPSITELPSKYKGNIVHAVVEMFSKRGAEGQISHNENGINRTYATTEYPRILYRNVVPYVSFPSKSTTE